MNEVQQLRVADRPVDNGVVDLLADLLQKAQTGEIVGLAGVAERVGSEFIRFNSPSVCEKPVAYLGYLRVLMMKVEAHVESEPPCPAHPGRHSLAMSDPCY